MSTTTLQFKFRVGGTLTNATSVVLSDATGTYGVRRTDTLATVVNDGTAMTNASTGVYTYSFSDPAADLTYQWVAEVVYSGTTLRFQFTTAGGAGDSPEGDIVTYDDIVAEIHTANLKAFSNLEGGDTVNTAAVLRAIQIAEAEAATILRGGIYAVPFQKTGSDWPADFKYLLTVMACFIIYKKRGMQDKENAYYQGYLDAKKELRRHKQGQIVQFAGLVLNSSVSVGAVAYNHSTGVLSNGTNIIYTNSQTRISGRLITGVGMVYTAA